MNKARQAVLNELLPRLEIEIPLSSGEGDLINPSALFPFVPHKTVLEIGFGNGEHVAAMMRTRPDDGFIGCEPFVNGMAAFLKTIKDEKNDHVRVWMDDAMEVVDHLTGDSLDEIYVLNPDPWPKTRHHKRRIISQANLDKCARVLKPGGF